MRPLPRLGASGLLVALAVSACDGDLAYVGAELSGMEAGVSAGLGDATVAEQPACAAACLGDTCAVDYCSRLPALGADPVIDGRIECGLALATVDDAHWIGAGPKPADLQAEYAAAWRPAGLYIFVHVTEAQRLPAPPGAPVFCGDATHLFADSDGLFPNAPDYDDPGTRQLIAQAPADATDPVAVGVTYIPTTAKGTWDKAHFGAFPVADGYVVEAFVVASDLGLSQWSLSAGGSVGLDLSISYGGDPSTYGDASTCAKRGDFYLQASVSDAGDVSLPHADALAFCTPALQLAP